jgi:ring-1,2-phenylacetyl-CoA epoxidase subunit PaaE
MAKFHSLRVSDVRRETEDSVSIAFEVPQDLKNDYVYTPGQYLTIKALINGEEVRRSYSICAAPHEGELRVAIKKVDGGKFSTYANEVLKANTQMEVMTPMGNFVVSDVGESKPVFVAFAAGSGITPVMSIMKTVLKENANAEFVLFYGNKSSNSIIFKEEIEDLKNSYTQRLSVHHVLSREFPGADLFYGRIDQEKCEKFCNLLLNPSRVNRFLLCGPEAMIREVSKGLENVGVHPDKVMFELFTTPAQLEGQRNVIAESKSTKKVENAEIKLIIDGEQSTFELSTDGVNILDSALQAGLDVPFACKGAVCMTCRAKVLEGEAVMDKNFALTDKEVEQGYVLTCQAHPVSQMLTVSFDD